MLKKCVFLDRDGVLNVERNDYTYKLEDFEIMAGVPAALGTLKANGFLLIVVTNQGGIARNRYTRTMMHACHAYLQQICNRLIDAFYYAPYHPSVTQSLSRKPGTLLFEKAMAKFNIIPAQSWMIGDRPRDIIPAHQLGMQTIQLMDHLHAATADYKVKDITQATRIIVAHGA